MAPGEGGTSEPVDEHYGCLCRFWILFLDIDAHSVNVKKLSMLADQLLRGYLSLSLAEGYQVGNKANNEKEGQYHVGKYP